ncbi:MAG: bifunctional adenosylcobinamide kinase/adenosylcobinamide-phosphate guanylyltransferase [Candidatus Rokuibacteriota bacterium]|nr:MAG: bifunctional adenosylcobinamide kinase/adenosylcobinamide-phosphate guanylyltransferase [Candidatus Rokubacteria bacterium]
MSTLFVLGGARSGKSRFALAHHAGDARVVFVATAEPGDPDMAARIARHRAERPRHWTTVEEPFGLVVRLRELATGRASVIVDCLTLWVANRQLRGDTDHAILDDTGALAGLIRSATHDLTLVSNEVGEGVHPETEAGLRFRDVLGQVNQQIAAACDAVTLMVAGIPVAVKTPVYARVESPQAP